MLTPEGFWPKKLSPQEFDACRRSVISGLALSAILGFAPVALTYQH